MGLASQGPFASHCGHFMHPGLAGTLCDQEALDPPLGWPHRAPSVGLLPELWTLPPKSSSLSSSVPLLSSFVLQTQSRCPAASHPLFVLSPSPHATHPDMSLMPIVLMRKQRTSSWSRAGTPGLDPSSQVGGWRRPLTSECSALPCHMRVTATELFILGCCED